MLKVGERAPEFTLPDDQGIDRSLTDFLTKGASVLFFYPADFMPVCSRQVRAFRDLHGELLSAGLRMVGISPQSSASHGRFRKRCKLPFALLSDRQKTVITMYGVGGLLGLGVRRATYLIDGSRRIRDLVVADFFIGRHAQFVRKAIALRATSLQ